MDTPHKILVTNNLSYPKMTLSHFFPCVHDDNGKLGARSTILGKHAYTYLKRIIHDNYSDMQHDTYIDESVSYDAFRCKLCGFKHGKGEIQSVARFKLVTDVKEVTLSDGTVIKLPIEIDLGSSCMRDYETIHKRHTSELLRRKRCALQIDWIRSVWNDTDYCYIDSGWRDINRERMKGIVQHIKSSMITSGDLMYMISKAFYNAQYKNMPIRLYRGIGTSSDLSKLGNVYDFMNGSKTHKFDENIAYHKDYVEIPVNDLKKML